MPNRDADGNLVYSQAEYEHLNFMGEPFCGFVEGIGYTCTEIVVTACPINASKTQFMFDFNQITLLWPVEHTDVNEDLIEPAYDESMNFLSPIFPGLGSSLTYLGNNNVPTRGKFNGTQPNTSYASKFFRYHTSLDKILVKKGGFIQKLPAKFPLHPGGKHIPFMGKTMKNMAQVSGRATPFVGRAFLVVGVATSAYNIHSSDYNPKIITQEVGGWSGAAVGAKGGAIVGGMIGAWFGGIGSAPGAVVGGIVGSILGYWGGYNVSGATYDAITK